MKKTLLVFVLLIPSLFTPALHAAEEVVEKILATVNDEVVTLSDLDLYRQKMKNSALRDELFGDTSDEFLKDSKKLLQRLVDERLLDSEVGHQNLTVTFERVEEEIRTIARQNNITRAQLRQSLTEQGTDFASYQDFLKKRLERQSLIQKAITSKIKISDEEVASYYASQPNGKGHLSANEYTLSHILLRVRNNNDAAAKARAEEVLQKLAAGGSFETLSEQFSEDPNYQKNGFLGKFKSGEFLKELEVAASNLEEGKTSGLVKTKLGYHILKLTKKTQTTDSAFEKQKEQIRGLLTQKAFEKQFQFWLAQKRREADIRYN